MLVHMNTALEHRGPDAGGIYTNNNIGLGHRRLSIIDLSPEGNQPMKSADGRYVMVYNGEIYNYKTLKATHRQYPYTTQTDSEVILALFSQYRTDAFQMLDGMFAIAIWDTETKQLFLARDRMGKKPLYFCRGGNALLFSSEIRGLLASGHFKPKINDRALASYLMFQTAYTPETMLAGVQMLPAGSYAIADEKGFGVRQYWRMEACRDKYTLPGPYEKVVKQTRELFFSAVEKRMISDVPLGAFLSGGIDSSAVVAAMSKISTDRVKTFNIYFGEAEFSERKYAEMVAAKFNTEHHSILIRPEEFLAEIPGALAAMDHPGADGPNTYVVSKHTKAAGITVALSGIGGDEMFGGYPVFRYMQKLQQYRLAGNLPAKLRKVGADFALKLARKPELKKLAMLAGVDPWDWAHIYPVFRCLADKDELKLAGLEYRNVFQTDTELPFGTKLISEITIAECSTYLENVLLRDTDQMSMAHSLEVRAPFLDKDLVEFMLAMPDDFKPLKPQKKLIIDAMGDLLPQEIWNRPKMGFTFPWREWVHNELKSFCDAQINVLYETEIFKSEYLDFVQAGHVRKGPQDWYRIWNLTVLGFWMKKNGINA